MRIHYIQHVAFEDLGYIQEWAIENGHTLSKTLLHEGQSLPILDDFDFLVIMGGPMNIYEENVYPWLIEEKAFIKKAIDNDKIVLGICLGAQLIADVLGGLIFKNSYKEIGWFPVTLSQDGQNSPLFKGFPLDFIPFHWHGDTFDLPPACKNICYSDACENQGFTYGDRVIGLQFHLEATSKSINDIITNCSNEIVADKYIQSADQILSKMENIPKVNSLMINLLDNIVDTVKI